MYKLSIIQKHTNLKISENILTCKKNWKHTTWKKSENRQNVNGYYMKKKKIWKYINLEKSENILIWKKSESIVLAKICKYINLNQSKNTNLKNGFQIE